MEVKIILMCLFIPCVDALYTEKKSDKVIRPEFSLKTDICKSTGQSLKVNCSIPNKYIRPQNSLPQSWNCSSTGFNGSNVTAFNNCSGSNSQSNIQTTFDIKRLRILHCTSSDRYSCIPDETTQISEKTVSLFKPYLSRSDTGTYFCQYNNVLKTEDNFYLTVGDLPVGPDDIACVSVDLMNLQCSWTKSRLDEINLIPVRYKSYFKSSPQFGNFDCPFPKPVSKNSIRDDVSCSISAKFHPNNFYTLCITMTNCLGSRIIEHNVSLNRSVKLSPPIVTSVQVEERKIQITLDLNNTTEIALIWIKKILYHVIYTSVYSSQVNIFNSSKENNIKVILSDLIPYTKYNVTIRTRGPQTVGDKYWSRPVTNSYTTKPTAPNAVPAVPPGGFSIHSGSLSLYLKPISRKDKHAANAHYKVAVGNGAGIIRVFNVSWMSTTIENVTTLQRGFDYKIAITTCNIFGETKNATLVTIPAGISTPAPINIIVEKSGHNYSVLWNRENFREIREEKTIVYWCHGQRRNNFCKSDFNWISVSNTDNNITLPNLTDKLEGEWLFAVSYHNSNGYNTGMVFAKCYFSSSNEAPSAVEPFNVVVKSTRELRVTPLLYCKYTNRPLKFIVHYKDTENNVKSCDKTFTKKIVTANIEISSITVRNLKQSAQYAVCLSVVTKGGSQTSDAHLVQLHATESKLIYIIFGVIVAVLLFAAVLFFICKCRKNMQKPLPIELPKIILSNYERVSTTLPEHTCTRQDRYSSDSGVASNTVSADISLSNTTIDDNESKNNINEQVINTPTQNAYNTANTETIIQKPANGYYIPNRQGIIQTNNTESVYKQIPSSSNENKCVTSNSDDNTSYRKITLSSSGLGDIYNYSHEDCTISNIKTENHKIVENGRSKKPTFDCYQSNKTENTGKRTSKMDSSNSETFLTDYISRGNDVEISLLLGQSSFDETDQSDESVGETADIRFHTSNLKSSCVDICNVPGYVQVGYNRTVK